MVKNIKYFRYNYTCILYEKIGKKKILELIVR